MGRAGFVVQRLLLLIPVAVGVTIVVFFMVHLIPGDPAATILGIHATPKTVALLHQQWGLNRPLASQYWLFLDRLLHGNLGQSIFYGGSVTSLILSHLPPTLWLLAYTTVLTVLISVPLAVPASTNPGCVNVPPSVAAFAIAAALKGYRCIFVMADKQSTEKQALLRAYGSEVVLCPTNVAPESPESYYSVAARLARDIPGAFKPDQYWNDENPKAHEQTTGPEIWEQTNGELTHFVASVGTGGTISGATHYLREKKPGLVVVGADPEGSVLSGDVARPYLTEGVGEDFFPETMDFSVLDEVVRVADLVDAFVDDAHRPPPDRRLRAPRARHQPQDRQDPRPHDPAVAPAAGGSGD